MKVGVLRKGTVMTMVNLLCCFVLLRLISLGLYPLSDTTEARYGNIARLMVETGNWITPQYTLGVPFWGKPPLSTWLAAGSMNLFGINEFAARLPSLLLALATMGLVWFMTVRQRGVTVATAALVVLISMPLFFVSSGAVMTDPALLLGTTLGMTGFWLAVTNRDSYGISFGYLFFLGLAVGLLAKGPVAVILTGLPIFGWVAVTRNWAAIRSGLPWGRGLLLVAILVVPWYLLAEQRTPGFLEYFLVGEHWQRFLVPGWSGDLYGSAHVRPKGTIWWYWAVCAFPWSLILAAVIFKKNTRKHWLGLCRANREWYLYLLLWAMSPMLFFTLAGNILWTYVLPGLPAFAILVAEGFFGRMASCDEAEGRSLPVNWLAGGMLALSTLLLILVSFGYGPKASQKELIAHYRASRTTEQDTLTYLFRRPYSAEFYSKGTADVIKDPRKAESLFDNRAVDYFAVREGDEQLLPSSFLARTVRLGTFNSMVLRKEKSELLTFINNHETGT
ncbi:MAG: hypothetical protein ACD_75C00075G0006 [uncultured bacterium]|nr:MAG: hypothetical protein ACD_75C00075G0006 [uncultured bacterium]HBG19775.1 phospholipid carrier-dependent glycosyltransferase [Desulfobulbaceae bacterium]